ncbi:MAG: nucleotide pyrophosphohydrolase [Planctomycetes bacterium]|nr:nucleotide pyrophosphohydrolase [Planctomycetota bacterium]
MNFDEYQRRATVTDQNPRPADESEGVAPPPAEPHRHEVIPLLGLVGEVGGLLAEYKKLLRDGATHRKFRDEVAEELGDILWYVSNVASKFDLDLEEIASANLAKVEDRWRAPQQQRPLYDEAFDRDQQLPRQFEYAFEHQDVDGIPKLVLIDVRNGGTTGDPLTDNAYEDDGYRYHDVVHLGFAACLGWSPVWRKLLRKQKRVANRIPRDLADAEDGGRAQVIEEAIVAAAYVYAADHGFLENLPSVDWHLLRHIRQLTANLEVRNVSAWEWNDALLRSFAVWRQLRGNRGGIVRGDLDAGTIEFIAQA